MLEIIGEIGVNHNGDIATAHKLVDAALAAGCDAVKTQLWNTERVYPRERWAEMNRLELSRDDIAKLKTYCDTRGIEFLCTPDEIDDARFLKSIGVKRIKTSSQDVTNLKFLADVAALGLPVILSTGACTLDELNRAVFTAILHIKPNASLTILHCVSAYPASDCEMNLRVIEKLRRSYYCSIGLSDHTISTLSAIVAVGCGATVFEKHLTLDTQQAGPDHAASITPEHMRGYVTALRDAERALGDGIKRIMPCEVENRKRYDEFIAPRRDIK